MSRTFTLTLSKIVSGVKQPDTGRTVTLRDTSNNLLGTATETPANSGQYVVTVNSDVYAYWYVDGVQKTGYNDAPFWVGTYNLHLGTGLLTSLVVLGNTQVLGSVTATDFIGDGSKLTGITGTASSLLSSANLWTADNTWAFGTNLSAIGDSILTHATITANSISTESASVRGGNIYLDTYGLAGSGNKGNIIRQSRGLAGGNDQFDFWIGIENSPDAFNYDLATMTLHAGETNLGQWTSALRLYGGGGIEQGVRGGHVVLEGGTGDGAANYGYIFLSPSGGNVAIGSTVNPNAKLTVSGSISALTVTSNSAKLSTLSSGVIYTSVQPMTVQDENLLTDASLGNHFRATLSANRTLANPTNPTDGQKVIWELSQDGTGNRVLSFDTAFAFGTSITGFTATTSANKTDYIGAVYNSTASKWRIIAITKGY